MTDIKLILGFRLPLPFPFVGTNVWLIGVMISTPLVGVSPLAVAAFCEAADFFDLFLAVGVGVVVDVAETISGIGAGWMGC